MTKRKDDRIAWVDIFKGLCIVLMVMGHSDVPGILVTHIYLFHMASFLIAAGFTYSGRKYSVWEYIKKRFFSLVMPYILINLFFIVVFSVFQAVGLGGYIQPTENIDFFNRLKLFFSIRPSTTELGGASWFLIVLFVAECLCRILQEICWKISVLRKKELIFMAMIGLGGYYLAVNQKFLPFDLDLGFTACLFFAMGAAMRRYRVLEHIPAAAAIVCSVVVIPFFGGAYYKGTLPVNWPTRKFPLLSVWILITASAVYLIYRLSRMLEEFPKYAMLLTYIGKHTFAILMWHFVAFRCLTALLVVVNIHPVWMLQSSPPSGGNSFLWIVYTLWALGFCLLLSLLFSRWKVTDYLFNGKYSMKESRNDKK